MSKLQKISGWGRYPNVESYVLKARYASDLKASTEFPTCLPQGNCRSYGDACLAPRVISTLPMHNLLEFDGDRGLLRCEAGITLDRILSFIIPRGFFLPVTPGTKFPTLGGCIAADVHGKNHHCDGSFAEFTEELEIVLADGSFHRCSRQEDSELFWATLGGMGLTGTIYAATIHLRSISSAFLRTRTIKIKNFSELCNLFEKKENNQTYSVAWIDCLSTGKQLGRSSLMLGEHVNVEEIPKKYDSILKLHSDPNIKTPELFPSWTLNNMTMRLFNSIYYRKQIRTIKNNIIHYDPYFYPLDSIHKWNRIYGKQGFLQYQFVIPFEGGRDLMNQILKKISHRGIASFLSVLKTLGKESGGLLSFPLPGYTLSLDIPIHNRSIFVFLNELTKDIVRSGGRIYLAKDSIMDRNDFEAMYPNLNEFRRIKRACDPNTHFRSLQSDRLGIT